MNDCRSYEKSGLKAIVDNLPDEYYLVGDAAYPLSSSSYFIRRFPAFRYLQGNVQFLFITVENTCRNALWRVSKEVGYSTIKIML